MTSLVLIHANLRSDDALLIPLRARLLSTDYQIIAEVTPNSGIPTEASYQALEQADRVLFIITTEAYANYDTAIVLDYVCQQYLSKLVAINWRIDEYQDSDLIGWSSIDIAKETIGRCREVVRRLNYVLMNEFYVKRSQETFDDQWLLLRAALTPRGTILDAFISYSRNFELDKVIKIYETLEKGSFRVWFDKVDIKPVEEWAVSIQRGIVSSANCVFFVSNQWLASLPCYDEFHHAHEMNKRGIAVYLEPIDEAVAFDIAKKRNDWANDEIARNNISQTISFLKEFDPRFIIHPDLSSSNWANDLFDQLAGCFQIEAEHVQDHTNFLIWAIDRKNNQRGLLTRRELNKMVRWRDDTEIHGRTPNLCTEHHRIIKESQQRIRQINFGIGMLIAVVLGIIATIYSTGQATLAQQEADAQRILADEINVRLQTLAQANLSDTLPVQTSSRRPMLFQDVIWTLHNRDGLLSATSMMGEPLISSLDVGLSPTSLVNDGRYVWVGSVSRQSVTRIDSQDLTDIVEYELPIRPNQLIVAGSSIWASGDRQIIQVSPTMGDAIQLSSRYVPVLGTSTGIFSVDRQSKLISLTNGQILSDKAYSIFEVVSDQLWAFGDGVLDVFDPHTGQNLYSLDVPTPDRVMLVGDFVWLFNNQSDEVIQLNTKDLSRHDWSIEGLKTIAPTSNHLWSLTENGLSGYRLSDQQWIGTAEIPTDITELEYVDDGQFLWLTLAGQSIVWMIDQETGLVARQFQPCRDVPHLIYDGVNMWFNCPIENTLERMPVDVRFLGQRDASIYTEAVKPIIIDDVMWLLNHTNGRLIAYDLKSNGVVVDLRITDGLLPISYENNYLWTLKKSDGTLYRIDPQTLLNSENPERLIQSVISGLSAYSWKMVGDQVWILHDALEQPITITQVDAERLVVLEQKALDRAITSLTILNESIWITTATARDTMHFYQFDLNGTIIREHDFPDTNYGAFPPALIDGSLWYPVVLPPISELVTLMFYDMFTLPMDDIPAYLGRFDPVTQTWHERYKLYGLTGAIHYEPDNPVIWLSAASTIETVDPNSPQARSGFFGIDIRDGTMTGPFKLCETMSTPMVLNNLVWVGCLSPSREFSVATANQSAPIVTYDDIGSYPWDPIRLGNQIWFTFRDTGNLAIFDVHTAELIAIRYISPTPSPPIFYNGAVWIYTPFEDMIIRIDPSHFVN